MRPTDEQAAALDLFRDGRSLVVEAGAGTGKTSTLRLLAASTLRRGQYLAFNKAIVVDVGDSMPRRVSANTAHSLAFRYVGRPFAHRLNSPRMRGLELAERLDVGPHVVRYGSQTKVLQPGFLASHVMAGVVRFCQSADPAPDARHFGYIDGIDVPAPDGSRTYANNDEVRAALLPALRRAWADVSRPDGQLPYRHDHYLKAWQLARPRIETDVIYFDEAQDANPVMAAVIGDQNHAQRVYVGDSNQAIYEFTGAVNALEGIAADRRTFLSRSFRFGPAIAEAANEILLELGSPLLLTGSDRIDSEIRPLEPAEVRAHLTRTNARAIEIALAEQRRGGRPHVVGGGSDVLSFARGADELQRTGSTWHRDLACFTSWTEVLDYVAQDAMGVELRLLVKLVEDYGYRTIERALGRMPREADADMIVSTAHKAKGREWDTVRLASDFAGGDPDDDAELRLLYVATTRARRILDRSPLEEALAEQSAPTPHGSAGDADT